MRSHLALGEASRDCICSLTVRYRVHKMCADFDYPWPLDMSEARRQLIRGTATVDPRLTAQLSNTVVKANRGRPGDLLDLTRASGGCRASRPSAPGEFQSI
jgi:hypothetical protein